MTVFMTIGAAAIGISVLFGGIVYYLALSFFNRGVPPSLPRRAKTADSTTTTATSSVPSAPLHKREQELATLTPTKHAKPTPSDLSPSISPSLQQHMSKTFSTTDLDVIMSRASQTREAKASSPSRDKFIKKSQATKKTLANNAEANAMTHKETTTITTTVVKETIFTNGKNSPVQV